MLDFSELTIEKVHMEMRKGCLTCHDLTEYYLERIKAYDGVIRSIILINPNALLEADRLDRELAEHGDFVGPLHGIPVLLKDNINTADMVTTAGSLSMAGFQPEKDAFLVRRLREAGALILAKTNLHEFAIWGETVSSVLGQTRNPYDLSRTPGGSSGGTGAAISADFGIIGIGTDTINSVRSPSSACSLVGIRPTMGLVSRSGIVPYSLTQDTAGPICRTVEDAAKTLDCIVGYDYEDAETAWGLCRRSVCYSDYLRKDGAKGKRIGILKSFFGQEPYNEPVNIVMKDALTALAGCGAELILLEEIIDSGELTSCASVHLDDFRHDLDQYLVSLGERAPVHSLAEILASGKFHHGIESNLRDAMQRFVNTPEYNEKRLRQVKLRTKILKIMADHNLDAIVYPHQQQLVCKIGDNQKQRNGVLCSASGFPSVVVPAGFSPDPNAPVGVPVGMEIVGRPFSEAVLIEIAYSFEQHTKFRKTPILTL